MTTPPPEPRDWGTASSDQILDDIAGWLETYRTTPCQCPIHRVEADQ